MACLLFVFYPTPMCVKHCTLSPFSCPVVYYLGGIGTLDRCHSREDVIPPLHFVPCFFIYPKSIHFEIDFPAVNWVVQVDCPEDASTYIHRVGRTARYEQGGESLLILLPSEEEEMSKQLTERKIPIQKIK